MACTFKLHSTLHVRAGRDPGTRKPTRELVVQRAVSLNHLGTAAADSLLESGIQGSKAAKLMWYSHVSRAPWLFDVGDPATAMQLAAPAIVMEAALFLPG